MIIHLFLTERHDFFIIILIQTHLQTLILIFLKKNSSDQHAWAGELVLFAPELAATSHMTPKDRNHH